MVPYPIQRQTVGLDPLKECLDTSLGRCSGSATCELRTECLCSGDLAILANVSAYDGIRIRDGCGNAASANGYGHVVADGNAATYGHGYGYATAYGHGYVTTNGNAVAYGNATTYGHAATIWRHAATNGYATADGYAAANGNAIANGHAVTYGNVIAYAAVAVVVILPSSSLTVAISAIPSRRCAEMSSPH